ncbi:type II CRISPR-associated endonuclease Cas1 [Metamycoplasma hyosynoviae]|uniref:type II CRISPR-associated endonuclease Cas1 n=2 Tax=Metamycoplasma hyosynoviae TaxID=29559 RepID=UPI00049FED76|nr:type II CRISPR-associated endonuclease Cas1 [Metamycoplasma hyosynoviae]KDE45665.1 CRISPR-associated protein Cas1 [Metamycoplasma hyosynoviae]MDC8901036.1 type II CRISPR-associated endonuclease Cas1 [Metamycoplasma hyosynoviae]MDC8912616.1 type II CRISPR-associated endonuclease Cas1 [Metamycoplasma hyosynoviae]MDC8914478.1 type II CRISPR-associated endonuclease Cas1 [Metamycoplasma hyosynoviae]MDC8916161.1 type II CRISPR-associated endonuclease Cas1 [Metamycoplasma hyosynoviae]
MYKKIIEINESNYAKLFLGNLILYKEKQKISIPTKNIDTVIFENQNSTITLPLINELVNKGVNIIICDKQHLPNSLIIPLQGHYNSKILQNQILWDSDFKNSVWTRIINLKILNSLNLLKKLKLLNSDDEDTLLNYAKNIKFMDSTNREAHAAKLYFKLLFGNKFNRQDDNNLINRYLNYGYSILMSYITRSIISKGYDCRIAIFHKSFNNYYALSTDLMEPFRCLIDKLVYEYFKNNELVNFQEFKEKLFLIFFDYIKYQNRIITINEYINYYTITSLQNEVLSSFIIDWNF